MEVFAEFFQMPDGKSYRKKTLLKFGESTDLIGSAVLMNPGSASQNKEEYMNKEFIKSFFSDNHKIENINLNDWFKFKPDSTMIQLEKIFNGSYLSNLNYDKKQLNGVIQLFNCFYYKSANSSEAHKEFSDDSEFKFGEENFFLEKPVYFGWGDEGKSGYLKTIASEIFTHYETAKTPIYEKNFEKNCFYHPGYINRSYNRNIKTQKLLIDFYNQIDI